MAHAIHLETLLSPSASASQASSESFYPRLSAHVCTGTAVYIFNILVRGSSTQVSIALDGNIVGNFASTPDETISPFTYDFPIFSMDGLSSGKHSVIVQTTGSNVNEVLFDYALYTVT